MKTEDSANSFDTIETYFSAGGRNHVVLFVAFPWLWCYRRM